MDFILNELSIRLLENELQAKQVMETFIGTCKKATEMGFNHIRYSKSLKAITFTESYTLDTWLKDKSVPAKYKDAFLTLSKSAKSPYIDPKNTYLLEEDKDAFFVYPDLNNRAEGLGVAWLLNTICISFHTDDKWNKVEIEIEKWDNNTGNMVATLKCDRHASKPTHINSHKRLFENHPGLKHGWCGKSAQRNESVIYCCTQKDAQFLLNTAVKHEHKTETLCNYDPENNRFIIFPSHLPNTYHGYHYENEHKDLIEPRKGISTSLQNLLKTRTTKLYKLYNT